ncbi:hypothetical protein [Nitrospirillum iridis]|uniref:Uncharacterized protein n=1 Tax=Nitrospirillum iridis TaxID=765888 RepID=A0A7X0AYE5_9PROT|nr:hypothetical protein [Nitrospirillum iridis]MBB6250971.1 hypothetical protein [Nitrospirillum iridis]
MLAADTRSSPAMGRRLLVAPGVYARLPVRPLATTSLGLIAQRIVEQTAAATASLTAASAFVYALTETSVPPIQFQDMPPFMSRADLEALQTAYDSFREQFATLQARAKTWFTPERTTAEAGAGLATVFSQIPSIPQALRQVAGTISAGFELMPCAPFPLRSLRPQDKLIRRQSEAISTLLTTVSQLGQALESAAAALVAVTRTGPLAAVLAAYRGDVRAMTTAITAAQQQLAADGVVIANLGLGDRGAGVSSVAIGVVGLTQGWNPLGWGMITGGTIGAHHGVADIQALQGALSDLEAQIDIKVDRRKQDQAVALMLAGIGVQLRGVAAMNAAVQEELTTLAWLHRTLPFEVFTALADMEPRDLPAAQTEWNAITAAAPEPVSIHLWPSPAHLSAPSTVAAIGADLYHIAHSGALYHYAARSGTWTDMGVTALSCVGDGYDLVVIDGAPVASAPAGGPVPSSHRVRVYDLLTEVWTTISTFPASCVAVGGGMIYAVHRDVQDRRVYRYTGSGTDWTPLPALPGPDAAAQIAVAGGTVFAVANNSQRLYRYDADRKGWVPLGRFTCRSIRANGDSLGIIDTDNTAYVHDARGGGGPVAVGVGTALLAQLSNGDQIRIGVQGQGALWHTDTSVLPATHTHLTVGATTVFASDTDVAHFGDSLGDFHTVMPDGGVLRLPPLAV